MPTFKKFLQEDKYSSEEVVKMAQEVFDNCQPFLNTIPAGKLRSHSLYRGVGRDVPFLNPVRKDRRPKDLRREVHDMLDDIFFEEFGVRYRSQAVFCTPSPQMADEYGKSYILFPKGKFDYSYSPIYSDLWVAWRDYIELGTLVSNDIEPEVTKDQVRDFFNKGKYVHNENFPGIWKSNEKGDMVELMLHCDEYYLIPADMELYFLRKLNRLMTEGA